MAHSKRGRKCYATHAFSEIPNAKRREQNRKCSPTKGKKVENGCLTPAFLGVPGALHRDQILNAPQVGKAATSRLPSSGSPMLCTGVKSQMAHKWAKQLHHPCVFGGPKCSARGKIAIWPTSGHSGYIIPAFLGPQCSAPGKIQIWPTSGQRGYITPAFLGVPNALHGDQI